MERVHIDKLEASSTTGRATKHAVTEALEAENVAINQFRASPGEHISGLHAHGDQEELFVVLEGTGTVETLDGESTVTSGEAIRFPPEEYHSLRNASDESLMVLGIGAPPHSTDIRIPLACPACDHDYREPVLIDETPGLACPGCGAERTPTCPDCESRALVAALGPEESPVSVCRDCGAITHD